MRVLTGHTSAETAYVVDDYPYGFRLRTSIRYWIETKKGHGQRFVSQTLNPKTGRWNKPKAGTYSPILVMFINSDGHIHSDGLSGYSSDQDIADFERRYGPALEGNREREMLRYLKAAKRAEGRVTWSIESHVCSGPDCEECKKPHQSLEEQAAIMRALTRDELWREAHAAIRGETYPPEAS